MGLVSKAWTLLQLSYVFGKDRLARGFWIKGGGFKKNIRNGLKCCHEKVGFGEKCVEVRFLWDMQGTHIELVYIDIYIYLEWQIYTCNRLKSQKIFLCHVNVVDIPFV